jgi:hypothetical protein
MKQLKFFFIFLLSALLLSACQAPSLQKTIVGSKRVTTQTRAVSALDAVEMRGFGHLIITQGDTEALTIEAEDNLIPYLVTEMRGSTLVIRQKPLFSFKANQPILFRLTVRSLDTLKLTGFTQAEIDDLRVETLKVELKDFSQMTIAGLVAQNFEARVSGFSRLAAAGVVDSASVEMKESAVYQHDELTVR